MKVFKFLKYGTLALIPIVVASSTTNYLNYSLTANRNNDLTKNDSNTYSNYNDYNTLNSLNNYGDYSAVNGGGNFQTVATTDGVVGISNDKKTLIMTSYNGSILWLNNLSTNSDFKEWVNKNYAGFDISNVIIKSYVKKINENRLIVLVGNNDNSTNNFLLNINLNTGEICSSNNNYAINKVFTIGADMVVETGASNVFVVINSKANWNGSVAFYKYTVTDYSITSKSTSVSGLARNSSDVFLGYVAGTNGYNFNLMLFASYTYSNGRGTTEIYYVVVTNELNKWQSGNNVLSGVIASGWTDGISAPLPDYRYDNGPKQFIYLGDRNNYYNNVANTIRIAMPFYLKNSSDNGSTWTNGLAGLIVAEIFINPSAGTTNLKWNDATDKTGRINQLSGDGNTIFTTTEYTSDSYTNNGYGNMANVVNVSQVNSVNSNGWKIAGIGNGSGTQLKNVGRVVAIPNQNLDSNSKVSWVYRNKNDNKLYVHSTTWKSNSSLSSTTANANYSNVKYHNDVNKEMNDNSNLKNYIATAISPNNYLSSLKYKDNSSQYVDATTLWNTTIENVVQDDDNGLLSYDYKVSYTAPYDSSTTLSYYVSVSIGDLYKLSNIKLQFVKDATIDNEKYKKITELKATKAADQITKEDVLNYFLINTTFKDKDDADYTVSSNDINLSFNENKTSLTVTVTLPSNKFPTTNTNKFTFSYTFDGFLNTNDYVFSYDKVSNDTLKQKYPSEVTLNDLFNTVVHLSSGYSTDIDSWDIDWVKDNVNGTLTINSLTYKDKNNPNLPEQYTKVIKDTVVYYDLKNTVDLFSNTIKINNIDDKSISSKPTELWKEYTNALNSNDPNKVKDTVIYKSIDSSLLLVNPLDLVLEVTNLDSADDTKTLIYKATIKENAELNYSIPNDKVIFTKEYENKVTTIGKYPIQLTQTVNKDIAIVQVDKQFVDDNKIEYIESSSTLNVDLDISSIGDINNQLTTKSFKRNFDNYHNDLLKLFYYEKAYSPTSSLTNVDYDNNKLTIDVEFILNDLVNYPNSTPSVKFVINIINFKPNPDVDINQDVLDQNNNVEYIDNQSVYIDISKNELFNMNNRITYNEFIDNFENQYKQSVLNIFEWSSYYSPTVSTPLLDEANKNVNIEIVFVLNNSANLKNTDNKPDKINMSVTIVGFKEISTTNIILIITIILIALIILTLSIYFSIVLNKDRKNRIRNLAKNNICLIEDKKDKQDK